MKGSSDSNNTAVRALVPAAMVGQPSRRSVMRLLGGVGLVTLGAACGTGGDSASVSTARADGKLESALAIYTWGEYDNPKVLGSFTNKLGPKIELGSYTSNEEMIAKLVVSKGTAGYDIVVPSDYVVPQMVENGLLAELDHSLIPNLNNVSSAFRDQEFDPGNKHTVVKDWGVTGYVYDTTKIERELSTWTEFWDAAQNEASGSFSLLDASGDWAAAYFNANGIDQNTTKAADLDAYEQFMLDRVVGHIQTFDTAPGAKAIPQASRTLMQCWNGDARLGLINSRNPDRYRWVFPTPVTNRWQDTWAIAAGAQNVDAAHAFINYVLDPQLSLREARYIGYDTAIEGLRAAAQRADMEYPEMVFFTDEQIAATVPYVQTSAAQRLTEIETNIRAAASA